ncbi:hypothetical protein BDP27DRAFT_1368523 [Rhodocollybia butyracea]|uniref:Uncharacterized protein n=1 Tax=Rhodocollybia butyracea TaxID=206335 RepID=A0A9P5PGL0_9AGAR|nr:hypothetical protein BDP27DRAFT_1368523 [Rhodocollybia butyracea]
MSILEIDGTSMRNPGFHFAYRISLRILKIDFFVIAYRFLPQFFPPELTMMISLSPRTITKPSNTVGDCGSWSQLRDPGSSTPLPTEFEKTHIFTGVWSPGSQTPLPDDLGFATPMPNEDGVWSPGARTAESSRETGLVSPPSLVAQDIVTPNMPLMSSEPEVLNHWILNPKLLGIAIRVDIREPPRNEVSEDGPPAQMPNTKMARLENIVDAIATKYVNRQEREELLEGAELKT